MPSETLYPDAIIEHEGWSEVPEVTEIDEDVDSPGVDWIEAVSNEASPYVWVTFPTPSESPRGLQTFRAWVRRSGGTGEPIARFFFYEGGEFRVEGKPIPISNDVGEEVSESFDASLLETPDGSLVEVVVFIATAGGSSADLDAVNWEIGYEEAKGVTVVAPAASATASAPAPAVSIAVTVQAEAASSTASAPAPALSIAVAVQPEAASSVASAPAPTLSVSVTIKAEVASASTSVLVPTVSITEIVQAEVASTTTSIPVPTLSLGITIKAEVAGAIASVPIPTVNVGEAEVDASYSGRGTKSFETGKDATYGGRGAPSYGG